MMLPALALLVLTVFLPFIVADLDAERRSGL